MLCATCPCCAAPNPNRPLSRSSSCRASTARARRTRRRRTPTAPPERRPPAAADLGGAPALRCTPPHAYRNHSASCHAILSCLCITITPPHSPHPAQRRPFIHTQILLSLSLVPSMREHFPAVMRPVNSPNKEGPKRHSREESWVAAAPAVSWVQGAGTAANDLQSGGTEYWCNRKIKGTTAEQISLFVQPFTWRHPGRRPSSSAGRRPRGCRRRCRGGC